MPDWMCTLCGNTVRDRARAPSYCGRCSVGDMIQLGSVSEIPAISPSPTPSPPMAATSPAPYSDSVQGAHATLAAPVAPTARTRSPKPAKRVQPREPLEVRFARSAPLDPVNISATGLLVEYVRPFTPGSVCDVELWRSELGLRLRAEVVRSVVSGGGRGSIGGMRYRTAVHFLKTPKGIYTLVPELSEEA